VHPGAPTSNPKARSGREGRSPFRLVAVATVLAATSGCRPAAAEALPTPAAAGVVDVRLVLGERAGTATPAADAVVWLTGGAAAPAPRGAPRPAIAQRRKTFEPHVEVVPVGAEVDFPNFDRVYHNVFSLSEIAPFDLGLYRNGASRSVTFARPGVVRIYCNIHPQMSAFLVVVDSVHYAKSDTAGRARIAAVPAGVWTLHAWHEKADVASRQVTVPAAGTTRVEVELDGSRWRQLPHKNKYGKEYPPPDDDQSRY